MARSLGYAGLLPQIAVVVALLLGDPEAHFSALALGYAYAALILSYVGGLWWGLAARAQQPPGWIWIASVLPSLIALATAWPWMVGLTWPRPSLIALGIALAATLAVDRRLDRMGIAPSGWMALRTPLSLGLAALTLVAASL